MAIDFGPSVSDSIAQEAASSSGQPVTSSSGTTFNPDGTTSSSSSAVTAPAAVYSYAPAPAATQTAEQKKQAEIEWMKRNGQYKYYDDQSFAGDPMEAAGTGQPYWYQGAGYYGYGPNSGGLAGYDQATGFGDTYSPIFLGSDNPSMAQVGVHGAQPGQYSGGINSDPMEAGGGLNATDVARMQHEAALSSFQNSYNSLDLPSFNKFENIWADVGHGLDKPQNFGYSDYAALDKYATPELFGNLQGDFNNDYLNFQVRPDLAAGIGNGGGLYGTTAEQMYNYFQTIPGALEDPNVQQYLYALFDANKSAKGHNDTWQQAQAKRSKQTSSLALAAIGGAAGLASAAAGAAAGAGGAAAGAGGAGAAAAAPAWTAGALGLSPSQLFSLSTSLLSNYGASGGDITAALKGVAPSVIGAVGGGMLSDAGLGGAAPIDQAYNDPFGGADWGSAASAPGFDAASFTSQFAPSYSTAFDATGGLESQLTGAGPSSSIYQPGAALGLGGAEAALAGLPAGLDPAYNDAFGNEPAGDAASKPGMDQKSLADMAVDKLKSPSTIAKLAKAVMGMLGGEGSTPPGAPEQGADQSDAEYADILVQYAGVDVDSMKQQGIQIGTPQYYEYVMAQLDSIIAQIFGGDPSALQDGEDISSLQAALRGKTQDEILQLQRALYVRGQMDTLSQSQYAIDPFTGINEDLGTGNGPVQGSEAAYQRGLARSADVLGGLRGLEARDYLGGMLGRNADIFNMRSNADAARLQAILSESQAEDERRRKAMAGYVDMGGEAAPDMGSVQDGNYWKGVLDQSNPRWLEDLLSQLGGDSQRQGAAVESLFGWNK